VARGRGRQACKHTIECCRGSIVQARRRLREAEEGTAHSSGEDQRPARKTLGVIGRRGRAAAGLPSGREVSGVAKSRGREPAAAPDKENSAAGVYHSSRHLVPPHQQPTGHLHYHHPASCNPLRTAVSFFRGFTTFLVRAQSSMNEVRSTCPLSAWRLWSCKCRQAVPTATKAWRCRVDLPFTLPKSTYQSCILSSVDLPAELEVYVDDSFQPGAAPGGPGEADLLPGATGGAWSQLSGFEVTRKENEQRAAKFRGALDSKSPSPPLFAARQVWQDRVGQKGVRSWESRARICPFWQEIAQVADCLLRSRQ